MLLLISLYTQISLLTCGTTILLSRVQFVVSQSISHYSILLIEYPGAFSQSRYVPYVSFLTYFINFTFTGSMVLRTSQVSFLLFCRFFTVLSDLYTVFMYILYITIIYFVLYI